ncbi:hypothetical protein CYMTET_16638, partial [Cymbomonas tetramitiformis]
MWRQLGGVTDALKEGFSEFSRDALREGSGLVQDAKKAAAVAPSAGSVVSTASTATAGVALAAAKKAVAAVDNTLTRTNQGLQRNVTATATFPSKNLAESVNTNKANVTDSKVHSKPAASPNLKRPAISNSASPTRAEAGVGQLAKKERLTASRKHAEDQPAKKPLNEGEGTTPHKSRTQGAAAEKELDPFDGLLSPSPPSSPAKSASSAAKSASSAVKTASSPSKTARTRTLPRKDRDAVRDFDTLAKADEKSSTWPVFGETGDSASGRSEDVDGASALPTIAVQPPSSHVTPNVSDAPQEGQAPACGEHDLAVRVDLAAPSPVPGGAPEPSAQAAAETAAAAPSTSQPQTSKLCAEVSRLEALCLELKASLSSAALENAELRGEAQAAQQRAADGELLQQASRDAVSTEQFAARAPLLEVSLQAAALQLFLRAHRPRCTWTCPEPLRAMCIGALPPCGCAGLVLNVYWRPAALWLR